MLEYSAEFVVAGQASPKRRATPGRRDQSSKATGDKRTCGGPGQRQPSPARPLSSPAPIPGLSGLGDDIAAAKTGRLDTQLVKSQEPGQGVCSVQSGHCWGQRHVSCPALWGLRLVGWPLCTGASTQRFLRVPWAGRTSALGENKPLNYIHRSGASFCMSTLPLSHCRETCCKVGREQGDVVAQFSNIGRDAEVVRAESVASIIGRGFDVTLPVDGTRVRLATTEARTDDTLDTGHRTRDEQEEAREPPAFLLQRGRITVV